MRLQHERAARAVNGVFWKDPVSGRTQKGDLILYNDTVVEGRQVGRGYE